MSSKSDRCSEKTSFWLGDTVLVLLILFPSMVFYWRGIWDVVGVYIFNTEEEHEKQCWTIIGIGSCTIFGYALHPVVHNATQHMDSRRRAVAVRAYMMVYSVFPMAYWRGVWTAADYYLNPYGWEGALIGYFICEVILHGLRVRQTGIFPPMFVAVDTRPEVLVVSTRYSVKPSLSWRYVLDALFSHFVALTLTILVWRCAWICVDYLLIPEDYILSSLVSLGIGYGSCLIILLSDPFFMKMARRISSRTIEPNHRFYALLAWEDFVYLVVFWGHLFIWRGCWNLNAEYIIADQEVGGWVNYAIGSVAFLVLQIHSYVGACGCVVDGHIDGTEDRWFPTHYLPIVMPFFKKKSTTRAIEDDTDSIQSEAEKDVKKSKDISAISEKDMVFEGIVNEGYGVYDNEGEITHM